MRADLVYDLCRQGNESIEDQRDAMGVPVPAFGELDG